MKIARLFPRRTTATPDDALAFTTSPPKTLPDIDEVHVSVTFTYDMERAEQLAEAWHKTGLPVLMGGAAFNQPSGEFMPGRYLKQGYVITSRGCDNHCWFCSVPNREGGLRELEIKDGFNILDDNLLACSEKHIREVFEMLKRQPETPVFTGGLEAKLLKSWHVDLLREVKPKRMYFAYDTPDDYEPLLQAGKYLLEAGFTRSSHDLKCYVLIGYPKDTFEKAEKRLIDTIKAGFMPMAMLYRDNSGKNPKEWKRFAEQWANKSTVGAKMKQQNF